MDVCVVVNVKCKKAKKSELQIKTTLFVHLYLIFDVALLLLPFSQPAPVTFEDTVRCFEDRKLLK